METRDVCNRTAKWFMLIRFAFGVVCPLFSVFIRLGLFVFVSKRLSISEHPGTCHGKKFGHGIQEF